jgi:glycosyltransferase involved in cell wall biosynthesis
MRFVVIGPTFPYRGGISHYTTLLVKHLQMSHEVQFFSFRRQYPNWLFPGRSDRDPSQWPLRVACEYLLDPLNPLTWLRTAQRISREKPDALILQWWVPYWAPVWILLARWVQLQTRASILFICHNVLPHEQRVWDKTLARWVLTLGDGFVVHSESDRQRLLSILPKASVQVVPLPSHASLSQTVTVYSKIEARELLSLPADQATVLFFGLVRPYKGLEILLEAISSAQRSMKLHLLVAGEFWIPEQEIRKRVAELNLTEAVTIVNRYIPNEELGFYFGAADVVVLPYLDATQSSVIQLAYGFGKPVITTTVGGLPDVVINGETGFLVPPNDSQALAETIIKFFSDYCDRDWEHTISKRQPQFSWQGMITAFEQLLEEKAQQHGRL